MTFRDTDIAAGVEAPAGKRLWRVEINATVKLALPIALTQLGQIAMMTTDLALIGRLGEQALAAAALAQTVLFVAFVLGMGLVSAVAPLAAQAFGARKPRMVRRSLRVGLWAALFLGVPMTALQFLGEDALRLLGQKYEAARLAARYLLGLGWSLIPAWWFIALRNFMGAVNKPEPALWITLAAIPANALLAYALDLRRLRHAASRPAGAGLATTIDQYRHVPRRLLGLLHARPFRKYQVLGRFWRMDWPLMPELIASARRSRAPSCWNRACSPRRPFSWAGSAPPRSPHIRSRCRWRRSCSWCRSASRLRRRCGSGTRSAAPTPPPPAGPDSARSASAPSSWRR